MAFGEVFVTVTAPVEPERLTRFLLLGINTAFVIVGLPEKPSPFATVIPVLGVIVLAETVPEPVLAIIPFVDRS